MKKIHNFRESLGFERSREAFANDFYRNILNVTEIKRFNSDSESDMLFQKQDIDVLLTLNGKSYKISEKFREHDYGDLYIEFYSKYPKVQGWLQTGCPDVIMYFTPKNVIRISHKSLLNFYTTILSPLIDDNWFRELYISGETLQRKHIKSNGKIYDIALIQAHNFCDREWKTFGVCIPYVWLENEGVKFRKFSFHDA